MFLTSVLFNAIYVYVIGLLAQILSSNLSIVPLEWENNCDIYLFFLHHVNSKKIFFLQMMAFVDQILIQIPKLNLDTKFR